MTPKQGVISGLLAIGVLSGGSAGVGAQEADRWLFTNQEKQASAMLLSMNTLSDGSRAIDYRPTLVISCEKSQPPVWRQSVVIHRSISGRDTARITVRYDNRSETSEEWTLADKNRTILREGADGLTKLKAARKYYLSWRFGVLAGTGEAVFDISGVDDALSRLAQACNITE